MVRYVPRSIWVESLDASGNGRKAGSHTEWKQEGSEFGGSVTIVLDQTFPYLMLFCHKKTIAFKGYCSSGTWATDSVSDI
jgi:hypothetical protein